MAELKAVPTPGGGHDILSTRYRDPELVLVHVRPVGTLEWGDLTSFADSWVPDLCKALMMAQRIANRDDPNWNPATHLVCGCTEPGDDDPVGFISTECGIHKSNPNQWKLK
jgi:hypothetical protein